MSLWFSFLFESYGLTNHIKTLSLEVLLHDISKLLLSTPAPPQQPKIPVTITIFLESPPDSPLPFCTVKVSSRKWIYSV